MLQPSVTHFPHPGATCRLKIRRFNGFTNDVIFVDGLWGTGKSLIAPVISGMRGVEKQRFDHVFEWLCILRHLNRIDQDATIALLQTYADLDQYNNLIGREVNLRWVDDSGPARNPNNQGRSPGSAGEAVEV